MQLDQEKVVKSSTQKNYCGTGQKALYEIIVAVIKSTVIETGQYSEIVQLMMASFLIFHPL